ncbi:MAG: ATP-dependent helicase [Natronospirillum sp.]|uniref:ATP-dependent helicase n=1 Tax=Natronospirillum sp. TaxID=2812955 RepID=UPI0025F5E9D6|nr:ATP-dependent helicase [Natronospirillum sp.]MCH8550962.1 ATP-dependent helicase [Natronospirillum sp.]
MNQSIASQPLPVAGAATAPALTDEQQAVVSGRHHHQRVIAVAGSGKTATLLAQANALLDDGVNPRRLLVLMYNRTARNDFLGRFSRQRQGTLPDVRTFHALGLSIYRTLVSTGDLPAWQGDIMSDRDLEPRIWHWLQELATTGEQAQDIQANRRKWVEPAMNFIERVKSGLDSPDIVFDQLNLNLQAQPFIRVYNRLEQWRKEHRRITYADMLHDPVRLFAQNPELAARFADHLDHVIVDEFQDINACQHLLLDTVAGTRATVTIVGDPDQTIYEFRGSSPTFMLHHFPERYPTAETRTLSASFRYGPELARIANALIAHNRQREAVQTRAHPGAASTQVHLQQTDDEVAAITTLLQRWAAEGELHDVAILHRLWAQAGRLELQLLTDQVPFELEHGGSVLQRSELRPLLALLRLAGGELQTATPEQRFELWHCLLSQPFPKIQRKILREVAQAAARSDLPPYRALMASLPDRLSYWQQDQLALRADVIRLTEQPQVTASRLFSSWLNQTDYLNSFDESAFSAQQADEQKETVRGFLTFMRQHDRPAVEVMSWLNDLLTQRQAQSDTVPAVRLTSLHKAKGREWRRVIIPGLNRHFYPYRPEGHLRLPVDEEGERRLLYVGITRAREELHLLTPKDWQEQSAFVQELGLDKAR